jgi:hypothetical protein
VAVTGVHALSRRELLRRGAGLLAAATVLEQLRFVGFLEEAYAAEPNVVQQTMNGLVAYVVPGRDRYSRAQGTRSKTAGGIEVGATGLLIRTLDRFLPGPLPLSSTAATILNEYAKQVDPSSARGKFASPFANLSAAEKTRVFQTVERLPVESAGSIQFLVGNLPDLAAFLTYSRPAAWKISRYSGVSNGHKELKGYWHA